MKDTDTLIKKIAVDMIATFTIYGLIIYHPRKRGGGGRGKYDYDSILSILSYSAFFYFLYHRISRRYSYGK
jgi:hypothetical protein